MSRHLKTGQKNRATYIYYNTDGDRVFELKPGENGVTETDIELLHSMDDAEVDDQRRYEYRVPAHLDAYHDGDGEEAGDRNNLLADNSTNPERLLISQEDEAAYADRLLQLGKAMNSLQPQQRALFEKVYVQRRTNVDIAAEEGVTEAAIRNRLKKIREKLKKYLL
jgi:RNA polymerase sigma factor (sigma-70 family)